MSARTHVTMAALLAVGVLAGGCAHGGAAKAKAPKAVSGDATQKIIATADAALAQGTAEMRAGHLASAREAFDRAVDAYLTAPGGAMASPRLAEGYRRALETIHLLELEALAAGDGFTEGTPEAASIDDLASLRLPDAGAVSAEVRKVAEEALKGESNDMPIDLNDEVLACIDLYQGELREWFGAALARGGRYLPFIREVFASEGLPQDLAYVALVESAFKTQALSRAKAKGVWQFIPATGKRYGLKQDWWVDERSNPDKATRAAAAYLKTLHGMFGDWNLALAAYNAGEGRVLRALSREDAEDFWSLARAGALPRETRNYVPMIQAAVVVAKAPEKYGFQIEPDSPLASERVAVKGAVDLRVIAECADTDVLVLREMNPELRRMATPARVSYELRVPHGTAKRVGPCLDKLPPDKRVTFRTHVVSSGQTLSTIARKYGARVDDVAEANGISVKKRLARGQELIIPVQPKPAVAPRGRSQSASPVRQATGGPQKLSYTIRSGDTLAAIAARFNTTVKALSTWNRLRGTRIAAGQRLTIYRNP